MDFKMLLRFWRALGSDPETKHQLDELMPIVRRTMLLLLASEILALGEVYPIKMLIDLLSAPADYTFVAGLSGTGYFWLILAVAGSLYVTENTVTALMDVARNSAAWKLYIIINGHGHRKQFSLGADWHVANSSGKKESLLSKNHKKVDYMIDNFIFDILPLTVRIVLIAVGTFFIGWQFGVLAVVTIAAYLAWAWRNEGKLNPMRKEFRSYTKRIELSDAVLNSTALTIKELGRETDFTVPHDQLLVEHWATETPRHGRFRRLIWQQDQIINASRLTFYAVSYFGALGGLPLGTVVLANAWMERIYANIWRYGSFQYILNESSSALRELVEFFETRPTIEAPANPVWPTSVTGRVRINDVSFCYPSRDGAALHNICLDIPAGSTVALVGPSGSGKSTLAKLIQRMYDPTSGNITIDGVDLREFDPSRFRSELLCMVPQEPGLFDGSVAFNIAITDPSASFQDIVAVAERSGALEFISKLPDGFDTTVGERGVKLSGGEKQRLALARALLCDPAILVLDEPTSALDAKTQLQVSDELQRLSEMGSSTVIIIAHRFSTIAAADLVVVMDEGRIVELGTHDELYANNGLYRRLYDLEMTDRSASNCACS